MNSYSSSFYKCPNLGVERSYIYKVDTYSWGMAWQDGGNQAEGSQELPTVGQNHLTQWLFYNKVLNNSYNLLNPVLKVKNRMAGCVQNDCNHTVVDPPHSMADWELLLALSSLTRGY